MPNKRDSGSTSYLKYSGLAVQIVLTILLLAWAGKKLDEVWNNTKPWMTLCLSLLGLVGSMVYLIQRVSKNK